MEMSEEPKNTNVQNEHEEQSIHPPEQENEPVVVVQQQETNGMAVTALILGIVSIVLVWIPFLPYITALLAVIFGIIGLKGTVHRALAIVGLVLGALAFILKIGFWIMLFIGIAADLA